ncbi:hypothetical protein ACU8OP_07130 [Rhizobium leguminosarum]
MIDITDIIAKDRFFRNEDTKTCIHEAAHSVAAIIFGFPIYWVSLDRDFIRQDEMAIKHECAFGDPMAMIISSDRLTPIFERGYTKTVEEKQTIRNYCIMCLAGPVAEELLHPESYEPEGSARDFEQAAWAVGMIMKGIERRRAISRASSDTHIFVRERRREIGFVARALQSKRTLFPSHIRGAIDAARAAEQKEAA